jgi:hypothetical protein
MIAALSMLVAIPVNVALFVWLPNLRRRRRTSQAARWVGVRFLDPAGRSWTAISSSGGTIVLRLDGATQYHAIVPEMIGGWYTVAPDSGV